MRSTHKTKESTTDPMKIYRYSVTVHVDDEHDNRKRQPKKSELWVLFQKELNSLDPFLTVIVELANDVTEPNSETPTDIETRTGQPLARFENGQLTRLIEKTPGALDRPEPINIDARHSVFNERVEQKLKFARCGNCGARYEITDDATENHHRAMRHKITCGKGDVDQYSEPQRQALLEEFHAQPMQQAYRERLQAEIQAGADPEQLKLTGVDPLAPAPARPQLTAGDRAEWVVCPTCGGNHDDFKCPHVAAPARWWQFWKWFR